MKMISVSILILLVGLSNGDLIQQIRDEYNRINRNLDSYKMIESTDINLYKDTNPDSFSFESQEIYRLAMIDMIRYYDSSGIRKAVIKFNGDRQDMVSEYYYKNDSVFFVFKTMINYDSPKWSDDFDKNKKEVYENRFYFSVNKLIKWIGKNGKSQKLSSIHIENVEHMLSDSKLYAQIEK